MKRSKIESKKCPCHSKKQYKACCKPYHSGKTPATPEQLMRSRFSAYALGLVDYIISTTDPQGPVYKRPEASWRASLVDWCTTTQFLGLMILDSKGDTVTFRADLVQHGKLSPFIEQSLFKQVNGRWYYHSGQMM